MPSAKLHQCVQDVMAQGHDEDSAYAICNSQIHERHRDFQRIYDEFCNYYKDPQKGEREYRDWLNALHLNDTVEYGRAQESFKWAKDMLTQIREDADNKYYRVVVGFPIKSMNGNVYKERDLIAAALTLKGTHPSLNHKDEYWFSPTNPHNRWGTLTTEAAKYEDGAIEAILKVPKDTVCPICNGAKMTELIDSKRIVNVSLEGGCSTERYGECEGFTFNEKGFTLLTTDILPGIPMARIFPLEHIMVEALQSSTKGEKRMKIKAIVKESGTQDTTTTVYDNPMSGTNEGPSGKDFKGTLTDVSQQTNVAVGTDPAQSKPEGVWQTSQNDQGKPVPHEKLKRWKEADDPMTQCMSDMMADGADEDAARTKCSAMMEPKEGKTGTPGTYDTPELISPTTPMPKVDSHIGPDKASAPDTHLAMPDGDTSMHATEPSKWRPEIQAPYRAGTFPSLEERKARIQAELKAKSAEEQALVWETKHNEVYQELTRTKGQLEGAQTLFDKLNERSLNAESSKKEYEIKYAKQCELVTDQKEQLDRTTKELNATTEKYNKLLKTSLELNQKWTKADEDYLDMARKVEGLEDKLSQARKEAKRIVRIKA